MRLGLGDEPVAVQTRPSAPSTSSSAPRPVSASGHPAPLLYFLLVLPFLGLLLWAAAEFRTAQLDAQLQAENLPLFSSLRPLKLDDLKPGVAAEIAPAVRQPTLKLEPYKGRVLLRVYDHGKPVRQRKALSRDLYEETILQRYYERTGDHADSVQLRYRRGKPYVFIFSEADE